MIWTALLIAMVAAVMLAGCAAEPNSDSDSGIEGTALQGPTCGGPERDPPEPGCEDKPYVGSLEVRVSPGTKVVRTFETGTDGSFRVALPPGTYVVGTPAQRAAPPTCGSDLFTVAEDAYTGVEVSCDTGIR